MKLKTLDTKERVKSMLQNVTKADLQDPVKVKKLVALTAKALWENLSEGTAGNIPICKQKIDRQNTFHLLKLWSMFR